MVRGLLLPLRDPGEVLGHVSRFLERPYIFQGQDHVVVGERVERRVGDGPRARQDHRPNSRLPLSPAHQRLEDFAFGVRVQRPAAWNLLLTSLDRG